MFKKIRNHASRSSKVMEIGFSQAKVSLTNLSILEDWLILEAGLFFVFFPQGYGLTQGAAFTLFFTWTRRRKDSKDVKQNCTKQQKPAAHQWLL